LPNEIWPLLPTSLMAGGWSAEAMAKEGDNTRLPLF